MDPVVGSALTEILDILTATILLATNPPGASEKERQATELRKRVATLRQAIDRQE